VALLDLGMTGRVNSNMQENLLRLLLAISEGNGDEVVKIVLRISEPRMTSTRRSSPEKRRNLFPNSGTRP